MTLPTPHQRPDAKTAANDWAKCRPCTKHDITCDGERPCTQCSELSIGCSYSTDPPTRPPTLETLGKSTPAASSPTSPEPAKQDRQELKTPKFVSVFAGIDSEIEIDEEQDDEAMDTDAIISIRAMESLLQETRQKMYNFQEYTVKPLLQQSRLDSKLQKTTTVAQLESSPFDNLYNSSEPSVKKRPNIRLSVKDCSPNDLSNKTRWNTVAAPIQSLEPDVSHLPKYKSIGRTHISMLARNVAINKYNHYLDEDENYSLGEVEKKYAELGDRYHNYEFISTALHAERRCAECVDMWRPWAADFLKKVGIDPLDIVEFYTRDRDSPILDQVDLTDEEVARWVEEQSRPCSICKVENKLDAEYPWNEISSSLVPLRERASDAASVAAAGLACMVFQKNVGFSLWHVVSTIPAIKKLLGITHEVAKGQAERMCLVCALHNCTIHGAYLEDPNLHIDTDVNATKQSYIDDPETHRNDRTMFTLPFSQGEQSPGVTKNRRKKFTPASKKNKVDRGKDGNLDTRETFVPCSHKGACQDNPACSCFKAKVACEHYCGCTGSCQRRWRGCTCATGSSRVCFHDARCECWKNSRECDPWLCKGCGVLEVLDQANKYDEDIRHGRCRNNRIQLGIPARTIKAPSEVQGYGLFAGQDLSEGDFIGEYKGELVSHPESDRRGAMYSIIRSEYLFILNATQQIDATNFGNKTRFMNNSNLEDNINVAGRLMLCSGVHRIMLYAKKTVKAGEELLYNYDYPEEVTKHFWERGEVAASKRAAIEGTVSKMVN